MKTVTIQELRRELAAKEKMLNQLQASRKKALAKVAKIDAKIAQLNGGASALRMPVGKVAKPQRKTKAVQVKRASNKLNLVETITAVLAKAVKPMRVKEVMNAVTKAGYKSASKQFYTIVATALRDPKKFKKAGRGMYQLVK